ncbi:GTP pyrophosphokinase [Planctomycetes bacterium Pan216]|uniref:GTP pyrophosphokinase n=1 Tax=Kolteria novifilia TaxID=2527975 RepID=A0A518BCI7_9BACT|nr:GTP pyrophosphokinase [Planctomycetes bacterium Pan216]
MATLELALEIAAGAHAGTKDRQGKPYILHPIRVMMGVESEQAQIVAILHDVVEDTDVTFEDLREAGFSEETLATLALVTHKDGVSYADYVIACKDNPIAREVKLSDLRDNSSLSRLLLRADRFDSDSRRMHRYLLSYRFLAGEIDEAAYRRLMPSFEK